MNHRCHIVFGGLDLHQSGLQLEDDMEVGLGLVLVLGVVGTLFGGMIGLYVQSKSHRILGVVLTVSSGILLSIIGFDLIPEALEHGSVIVVGTAMVMGILLIAWMGMLLGHRHGEDDDLHHRNHDQTSHHMHQLHQSDLRRAGMVMVLAVALHNVPSGLAIGAGFAHNQGVGLLLACLLAVHNLPEGIAMVLPLIGSGMRKESAFLLLALTGIPTLIGGMLGHLLSSVSNDLIAVLLSLAAGAMIYVTIKEIVPQAKSLSESRWFMAFLFGGVILGYLLIHVTHVGH